MPHATNRSHHRSLRPFTKVPTARFSGHFRLPAHEVRLGFEGEGVKGLLCTPCPAASSRGHELPAAPDWSFGNASFERSKAAVLRVRLGNRAIRSRASRAARGDDPNRRLHDLLEHRFVITDAGIAGQRRRRQQLGRRQQQRRHPEPCRGGGTSTNGGTSTGGGVGGSANGDAGAPDMPNAGSPNAGSDSVVPTGFSLAEQETTLVRDPLTDGTAFSDRCPTGQLLIGFYGTVDAPGGATYLRSEQAVCGMPSVSKTEPWTVTVTETTTLPMHDVEYPQKQTAKCPADQVVVGFGGRSGVWMDTVDVRCAPLKILGMSPTFLLVTGTPAKAGTIGGNEGGSPFDPLDCEAGSVAVGQIGNSAYSGAVLGTFGVRCAAITLDTGPG